MKIILFLTLLILLSEVHLNPFNVLLITVDDLRPSIGVYDDLNAVTPNIDLLAKEGVVFKNAFAQQALCAPSRNSFLTSRRPDTLHLYDFYSYWRKLEGNFTTLPEYFKENHYFTKSIGKIFHPGISSGFTDDYPYSWSEPPWHPPSDIFKDAAVCSEGDKKFANLYCPVKVSEQPMKTLPDLESVKEAKKFLKHYKSVKPFFLAVGFHKPHIPFKFPEKYAELHPIENITLPDLKYYPPGLPIIAWNPWNDIRKRHDIAGLNVTYPFGSLSDEWIKKLRQGYYSSVSYVDHLIGEVLRSLKLHNFNKNTIVILLGDHGWSLGEHGEWSKYSNFDVAVKVPLIIRIPNATYFTITGNATKTSAIVEDPVELIDLFPTLVDLVGLGAIPNCRNKSFFIKLCTEGNSLIPLIKRAITEKSTLANEKNTTSSEWDKFALSQYPRPGVYPTKSPDSDEPKLHEIKFMGYSVRTKRYRYTEWIPWDPKTFTGNWSKVNQTEFYDHHIDPNENLNLHERPGLESIEKKLKFLLKKGFSIAN